MRRWRHRNRRMRSIVLNWQDSGAVVGMVRQQRGSTIELFGKHQTHQHMRQCQRTERPGFIRTGQHLRRVTFGATDQESEIAAAATPVFQPLCELFGAVHPAATIKRNDLHRLRQRRKHPRTFICGRARRIPAFAAHAGFDLDQFQRQPVRQALLVFAETLPDPRRGAFADGDEAGFHGAGSQAAGSFTRTAVP